MITPNDSSLFRTTRGPLPIGSRWWRGGFTLIELLIVVAIIAILAAIAVPNFLEAQTRSKVSRSLSDLRSIATGMEAYYTDNNKYPPGWINPLNPSNVAAGGPTDLISPRAERLAVLTTPVVWISTLPFDPFLVGKELGPNQVFSYWQPAHADGHRLNGAFNTPLLFQDVEGEDLRYGRYVLTSSGPDQTVEPPEHQLPGATLAVYDPTNGVQSTGEIWRFGP